MRCLLLFGETCLRAHQVIACLIWEFPRTRVPYFGVFIIRILLLRVLY